MRRASQTALSGLSSARVSRTYIFLGPRRLAARAEGGKKDRKPPGPSDESAKSSALPSSRARAPQKVHRERGGEEAREGMFPGGVQ